jgi:predicted nucleotidyltransferase
MFKMKKEDIIAILRPYCEKEKNIIFGFLFGSYAFEASCLESDIDIALYLKNKDNRLENKIQNGLERLLKKEVDLIILNRAPSILAWNIIRKGIPLTIKDRGVYLDFMLEVSREAEDLIDFNLDTWRKKYALGTS